MPLLFFNRKKKQKTSGDVTNAAGVHELLTELCKHQTPIQVQFPSAQNMFNSLVLQTSEKAKAFAIDVFNQPVANELIKKATKFTIVSQHNNTPVHFNSVFLGEKEQNGLSFYKLAYPHKVTYQQRRVTPRVEIPASQRANITVKTNHGHMLIGQLVDLSTAGIKAIFIGDMSGQLPVNELITTSILRVGERTRLPVSIHVRNLRYNPNSDKTTMGASLDETSQDTQRLILQLIKSIRKDIE
ncbi:MAG: hypothetical protein CMF25_04670 [Kangiellaceae bacterium]|jgi:c-di-GMP-binding flagellar brake protein YcgR|nr:hypothetical protein [Kangiellaceae bacterium]|tara:strand:- start:1354 stop:2079 length:726 start_codon:yes stop_codon:yes gene_type:complete